MREPKTNADTVGALLRDVRTFIEDTEPEPGGDPLRERAVAALNVLERVVKELRPTSEVVCVQCNWPFTLTDADRLWYASRGFKQPRRCATCRSTNRKTTGRPPKPERAARVMDIATRDPYRA